MNRNLWVGLTLAALTACGGGGTTPAPDASTVRDTGTTPDTGSVEDTGTTADTGSAEDTGTAGDAFTPVALDCETYCALQAATCGGTEEEQYGDEASCMGVCAAFTPGALGDTDDNTLGCRIYHTEAAASMTGSQHCLHAGPGGHGICGLSQCEAFCQIAETACTGANEQWATTAECLTACALYPGSTPGVPTGSPAYSTSETSGDTFACRMYHLTVAASSAANAEIHCGHIDADSPPCS